MSKSVLKQRKVSMKASPKAVRDEINSGRNRQNADLVQSILHLLKADSRTYLIYILLYIPTGFLMNAMGQYFRIGEYAHWWQVFTCYGLYLIPASLLVRHRHYFDQYLAGLLIIAVLELPAYSLGTSVAHPGSVLDQYLTPRNYTLFMTVFFAAFMPLGNWTVAKIRRVLPESRRGKY